MVELSTFLEGFYGNVSHGDPVFNTNILLSEFTEECKKATAGTHYKVMATLGKKYEKRFISIPKDIIIIGKYKDNEKVAFVKEQPTMFSQHDYRTGSFRYRTSVTVLPFMNILFNYSNPEYNWNYEFEAISVKDYYEKYR